MNHFRHARAFLSQMKCPVFLVSREYDFSNPPTLWDGEKEKFPDCTPSVSWLKTLLTVEETFKFNSVQSA
jgi:hypothetical protein